MTGKQAIQVVATYTPSQVSEMVRLARKGYPPAVQMLVVHGAFSKLKAQGKPMDWIEKFLGEALNKTVISVKMDA